MMSRPSPAHTLRPERGQPDGRDPSSTTPGPGVAATTTMLSHAGGSDPYLAHGPVISYTCEGRDGLISSWP